MSKTRRLLQLTLALAIATSVQSRAAARGAGGDSPPSPSIAKVEVTAARLDWSPVGVGNDPITLTLAGPQGFFFEKRFPRGTSPAFELGEVRERALPDGAYSYELRTMGKGADQVQSGFFSVREGKIFVPAIGASGTEPPRPSAKPSGPPLPLKVINTSECVGDGCGAGAEGSPLRLKSTEALRLDFTDLDGPFTNNHSWAIQANDVFLGGGTYLAVKDIDAATTPLTITANAPDNSLFVSSSGNVGLGTATPAVRLDAKVTSAGNAVARLQNLSSSGYSGVEYLNASGITSLFFGLDNAAANTRFNSVNNYPIVFLLNSTERLRFPTSGNVITAANGAFLSNGGTWTNASSRVLKQDIHDLDAGAALAALRDLNPVEFAYKADPAEHHVGFIAEDVPDLVAEQDRTGLSPMDVVAVLTKVVQEQQKAIEALTAQMQEMQRKP